jgi:peptide/nickel transport system substrate-binding protein
MMNPLANVGVNARGKTGGWFGWAEDAQIEKLRDAYARSSIWRSKRLSPRMSRNVPTSSAPIIRLDNIRARSRRAAMSKGVLSGPAPVFWNIDKM